MASTLLITVANFETTITTALTPSSTSLTLTSNVDKDGNTIPDGKIGLTINEGKTNEEHVIGDKVGSAVSSLIRNVSRVDGTTAQTGKSHRKGSPIKITNHPLLVRMRRILDGTDGFSGAAPLRYDTTPSFTPGSQELVTVQYADGLVGAGVADASAIGKGKVRMSVAPVSSIDPIAVGDNDPRVPTQAENDGLAATTTPASTNKFITQKDLQKAAELYGVSAAGSDTYAITLSPAPTAYAAGQVFRFKADVANTGAATLNVNSLGAKSILRPDGSALANGDIAANQIVQVIYDSTNFLMLSPIANAPKIGHGTTTRAGDTASGSQTIAHGLGRTPRFVRIRANKAISATVVANSDGTYNGSTTASINSTVNGGATIAIADTTRIIIIQDSNTNTQEATIAVDATNITLTWTKSNTPNSNLINMIWEAIA